MKVGSILKKTKKNNNIKSIVNVLRKQHKIYYESVIRERHKKPFNSFTD